MAVHRSGTHNRSTFERATHSIVSKGFCTQIIARRVLVSAQMRHLDEASYTRSLRDFGNASRTLYVDIVETEVPG